METEELLKTELTTHHIKFFRDGNCQGAVLAEVHRAVGFRNVEFNDQTTSVRIDRGRWALFRDSDFNGQRVDLGPGCHNLGDYHMNKALSSLLPLHD